jgi:hypothetical protein
MTSTATTAPAPLSRDDLPHILNVFRLLLSIFGRDD